MFLTKWFKRDKPLTRAKLREWLFLEDINKDLKRAVEANDYGAVASDICKYVSTALSVSKDDLPWLELINLFGEIQEVNHPSIDFPILNSQDKESKVPWDYKERTWFMWLHSFSRAYGWDEETIATLDVDTAIGLFQEILIDEQLEKEQNWQFSELAYKYDPISKTSRFVELPRPKWMLKRIESIKENKTPIPPSMLPAGIVLRWDSNVKH